MKVHFIPIDEIHNIDEKCLCKPRVQNDGMGWLQIWHNPKSWDKRVDYEVKRIVDSSTALCRVCRHLATEHSQFGLAPCEHSENNEFNVLKRCKCPNFLLDEDSLPDELTHSELDKKCFEFFEATNTIAEQLQRIGDILEGGIDVGVRKE